VIRSDTLNTSVHPEVSGRLNLLDKSFFGDFGISITVLVAPQQNSRRITNKRFFARNCCLLHPLKRWICPKPQGLGHFFGRYDQGHTFLEAGLAFACVGHDHQTPQTR
jgi:hypothetical protein